VAGTVFRSWNVILLDVRIADFARASWLPMWSFSWQLMPSQKLARSMAISTHGDPERTRLRRIFVISAFPALRSKNVPIFYVPIFTFSFSFSALADFAPERAIDVMPDGG
jgi:hypothetical protein